MKFIIAVGFAAFLISNINILYMDKDAVVKGKAFRWWVAVFALFIIVYTAVVVEDLVLMIFVAPVIAWITFGFLKFTKFCDGCGWRVQTNLPFVDRRRCPECGSSIS